MLLGADPLVPLSFDLPEDSISKLFRLHRGKRLKLIMHSVNDKPCPPESNYAFKKHHKSDGYLEFRLDGLEKSRVSGGMQYCVPPELKISEMFHTT